MIDIHKLGKPQEPATRYEAKMEFYHLMIGYQDDHIQKLTIRMMNRDPDLFPQKNIQKASRRHCLGGVKI